jgi:hypothetical protein
VNQELLSLSASYPSITVSAECFTVSRPTVREERQENHPTYAQKRHFLPILTAICSAFPDYDFSTAETWDSKAIESPEQARASLEWAFESEMENSHQTVCSLWQGLEKEIDPAICSIYSYEPLHPDPFSAIGARFNLCYLFYNERARKVALVHLQEGGKDIAVEGEEEDVGGDEETRYGYCLHSDHRPLHSPLMII